jgi:hypothetical protein
VAQAIGQWAARGVPQSAFGVVRTRSGLLADGSASAKPHACYPFEKVHTPGRALDISVGDLNGDMHVDLTDFCMFAASLESVQGGCGVYAHESPGSEAALWVHVDWSGKTDRWGERRDADGVMWPISWSKRERSIRERARSRGLDLRRNPLRLIVEKEPGALHFDSQRKTITTHSALRLYAGRWPLKYYSVALGFDAINDKEKRGDYRTPEGRFIICDFNPQSRFHRSLRLSYPNDEDARRGLRNGLIDRKTHDAIIRAIRRKRTPPQDTPLGGDIMLHGGGGARENWTWGCIALDNKHIKELFDVLPRGTAVEIRPASTRNG